MNGKDAAGLKKPSLLSQVLPYLVAVAILAWVFTGLSSNVVDERHRLSGAQWSELNSRGVRPDSIQLLHPDGSIEYCREDKKNREPSCPPGGDYEVREEERSFPAAVRRTPNSRIPDGAEVSIAYVKKIQPAEIWAMLRSADLKLFLPVMILHVLMFFFGDTFSFGLAYRWFNTPELTIREMMEVRGAPYVIQVGLATLAEVLFPLYMWRVKKVPVTETVSSNLWVVVTDLATALTAITPAVVYNLYVDNLVPAIGPEWLIGCVVFWVLYLGGIIFWRSPYGQRAAAGIAGSGPGPGPGGLRQSLGGGWKLLRTFSLARGRHSFKVYFIRMGILITSMISNYAALRAVGMDPPLPLAIIGIPVVVFAVFQPVGVGGYGGPQLIAWFLFVRLGQAGTADQAIAYSLLWSTGFLVGRALIGLVFIRGFWKRCFPEGLSF